MLYLRHVCVRTTANNRFLNFAASLKKKKKFASLRVFFHVCNSSKSSWKWAKVEEKREKSVNWCRNSPVWVSKLLSSLRPGVPAVRLDEWRLVPSAQSSALRHAPAEPDNTRAPPSGAEAAVELRGGIKSLEWSFNIPSGACYGIF